VIEKLLNVGIKLFALGVTTPATVAVIDRLFASYPLPVRVAIVVCGVGLVEGVLLLNWVAVDQRKNDAPEFKVRPVASVWVMYLALLGIGWAHGEGIAALPLRLALGLALAGASWDTIVYGWSKATARADRDIHSTAKVRREARRCAQDVAIATLRQERDLAIEALHQQRGVQERRIALQAGQDSRRVEAEYAATAPGALQAEQVERSTPAAPGRSAKKLDRGERVKRLAKLVAAFPDSGTAALVERYRRQVGVSETTAYEDLRMLREQQGGAS
jgi:hypothetical protein